MEERIRWQHLNDGLTLVLRAQGYEKAPLYNDTLKKFDDLGKGPKDEKSDEQIIEETLKLFEK